MGYIAWLLELIIVMLGVKVGNNVVIGSNSVVTINIPDNSIAYCNPRKTINGKVPCQCSDYCTL